MTTFRDLIVWQRGTELVELLYQLARTLPSDERFGLCAQLERAGVSIPSNIAEGHSRRSRGAFINHVSIAIGSQTEIGEMLYGLHSSLERSRKRGLLYSIVLIPFLVCCITTGLWFLASGLWPPASGL